jgi:hypothetical protein
MSGILELMLLIGPADEGRHPVRALLRERDSHPPRFQDLPGDMGEESWRILEDVGASLSQELLSLEYGLRRLIMLLPQGASFPRLLTKRSALSLFPGEVRGLAERFLHAARRDTSSLYRLTVMSQVVEVLEYPWLPVLLGLEREPLSWDEGQRRISVILRYPAWPELSKSFRPPLTLGVDGGRKGVSLDEFSRRALELGVLRIQDARHSTRESDVVHLIDRTDWTPSDTGLLGPVWPGLLVFQHKRGKPPPDGVVSRYLERGANAVLQMSGSRKHCRRFFQGFYRGILRNRPLEECVREVLAEQPDLSVYVTFGALEGGEYKLLFTRVAARVRSIGLGPLPIGGPDSTMSPEELERSDPSQDASRLRAVEPGIRRQARADRRSLARSIEAAKAEFTSRMGDFDEGSFNATPEALARSVRVLEQGFEDAQRLSDQRLRFVNTRSLMDMLDKYDDRLLQDGFTRLLNAWLSQDSPGAPVDGSRPLLWESRTWLNVKISPARIAQAFAVLFPDIVLDLAFRGRESLRLEVCVFHDEEDVRVDSPRGELLLPWTGESTAFLTLLRPQRPGAFRLRVCIFFRGTLLQSLAIEAEVAEPGEREPRPREERPSVRYTMDYVASPDFFVLEQRSRPSLSLVTNHAPQGDVWIGVFSSQDEGRGGLRSGTLHTLSGQQLAAQAQKVRDTFETHQGKIYNSEFGAENQAERARRLVQLAKEGARLFHGLFNSNRVLPKEELRALNQGLEHPGLISIARCNLAEPSIPWAMLYSLPLDTGAETRLRLCPVFLKQLEAKQDLLDSPDSCRALPECPLRGPDARFTVCPLGFWGVQHEIEQPVKQVRARSRQELEQELTSPAFAESCQLVALPHPPQAFMGCGSLVPAPEEHYQELRQLEGWNLSRSTVREEVIAALEREPHILYLYCHGSSDSGVFRLKFPEGAFIESTSLVSASDSERPPFFAFLNACESVATLPETLNDFLGTLLRMGALAVIGSEIKINNLFARRFARHVLEGFLSGDKLGRAFVQARRHFLRQLNPFGLAYTLHAAADVHLHAVPCAHCEA